MPPSIASYLKLAKSFCLMLALIFSFSLKAQEQAIKKQAEKEKEIFTKTQKIQAFITYTLKEVDSILVGESYKISFPLKKLDTINIKNTCTILLKDKPTISLEVINQNDIIKKASILSNTKKEMFKLLNEYKDKVLICLLQNSVEVSQSSTTINLEARDKSFLKVLPTRILASFDSGFLVIDILKESKWRLQ